MRCNEINRVVSTSCLVIRLYIASVITVISILFPAMVRSEVHTYPLLKDNPSSDSYVLKQVDEYWSRANITYSPVGNFFLIGNRIIHKINGAGEKVFSLEREEQFSLLPFTHYIATPKGLYDLSRTRPVLEPFVQVVNGDKDRTLTKKSFHEIYAQAYSDANIVVYDRPNFEEGIDKYRAYMWITGDWVLFYLSHRAITLDSDYDFGVTSKEYPAKFNRTLLLKDTKTRVYSASRDRLRDHMISMPEDKLRYPEQGVLKLMGYSNERVDETYKGTPVVHTGTAYHRLSYDGEQLFFREIAMKAREQQVDTQLNWYVLPMPYQNKTSIGFLEFLPGHNFATAGSGGVYTIQRK